MITSDLKVPALYDWLVPGGTGEALFLMCPGPKSLRPMWMLGLVQGATHILLKLLYSCVAKWCHLPETMFIIELLKAYSVAAVIHQHLQEALARQLSIRIEKIGTLTD